MRLSRVASSRSGPYGWDAAEVAGAVLTFMLAATTGAGVLQAREMARLRQQLVRTPDDATLTRQVSRRSRRAAALRAMIALLTLTLLGLVAS